MRLETLAMRFSSSTAASSKCNSRTQSTDWQQVPGADLETPGLRPGNAVLTVFVRNDSAGGTIYSTDTVLHGTSPTLVSSPDK